MVPDDPEALAILQSVRALALMLNALILLDEVGESVAAAHLQFSIDTLGLLQAGEAD